MKRKLIKWLIALVILASIATWVIVEAMVLAPNRIDIKNETIVFPQLPEDFEDLRILFFSDLHYSKFMDYARAKPVFDLINQLSPDLIIFTGDLFDHPSVTIPTEKQIEELTELFSQLKAPYGIYAVWGNHDLESPSSKSIIQSIYDQSDVRLLVNQSVRVYASYSSFIQLVGLDSQLLGNPRIDEALRGLDKNALTIALSHTPDIADDLKDTHVDWQLSGHSHGGQISLPFYGAIMKVPYARNYTHGTYLVDSLRLDVTAGLGTTRIDARFFANPEIHLFTLTSQPKE